MNARALPVFTGPNRTGELQLHFLEALVRRDVHVVRVDDLTPGYRRIVLGGDDLAGGFPMVRFAPSDHLKVYFPDPATGGIVSYRATEGDDDDWELDGPGAPIRRDYTPRGFDPATGELSLEFALHDHGVAGRWAAAAAPGDPLVVIGPRAHWLLPEDYPHYLAVGDATALPAISRILEEAPADATVTAFVEVADAGEELDLDGPGRTVHWVHRDAAPIAQGHVSALETAVKAWTPPVASPDLYAFAAGESVAMKPIRRHLRGALGLPKRQVTVDGYWKRGTVDFDHHTADLDED